VEEAPPEAAEEFVGDVAEGGVVAVARRSAPVVVCSGSVGLGDRGEGPPVAGIGESFVLDVAGARADRSFMSFRVLSP
jgi:hypothetical protein